MHEKRGENDYGCAAFGREFQKREIGVQMAFDELLNLRQLPLRQRCRFTWRGRTITEKQELNRQRVRKRFGI